MNQDRAIVLYDGVCALCLGTVQFLLRYDDAGQFRFAPLQGDFARDILTRHGRAVGALDTMYLVTRDGEREILWDRSRAAFEALRRLGGLWSVVALLRFVPRFITDAAYRFVATNRYRWFGKYDECPIPPPELRKRFAERHVEEAQA